MSPFYILKLPVCSTPASAPLGRHPTTTHLVIVCGRMQQVFQLQGLLLEEELPLILAHLSAQTWLWTAGSTQNLVKLSHCKAHHMAVLMVKFYEG